MKLKMATVFAHFDPTNRVDENCIHYLKELRKHSAEIIFVTTSQLDEMECLKINSLVNKIIQRENIGMDFCSYKAGVLELELKEWDYLLLANDSVYGPIYPLEETFNKALASQTNVYGICKSYELAAHLQSFFLLFDQAAFNSSAFHQFWQEVKALESKQEIIQKYEIGLSQQLQQSGLKTAASFEHEYSKWLQLLIFIYQTKWDYKLYRLRKLIFKIRKHKDIGFNPMQLLSMRLVKKHRIPFIKKELINKNPYHLKINKLKRLIKP